MYPTWFPASLLFSFPGGRDQREREDGEGKERTLGIWLNYLERFDLCASKKFKHENLIPLSHVVWFAFGSRYENQVKGHYIIN